MRRQQGLQAKPSCYPEQAAGFALEIDLCPPNNALAPTGIRVRPRVRPLGSDNRFSIDMSLFRKCIGVENTAIPAAQARTAGAVIAPVDVPPPVVKDNDGCDAFVPYGTRVQYPRSKSTRKSGTWPSRNRFRLATNSGAISSTWLTAAVCEVIWSPGVLQRK